MADIQSALPARFMQVANASKVNANTGGSDSQPASFSGVLQSRLTGKDEPTMALAPGLSDAGARKSAVPQQEAEAVKQGATIDPSAVVPQVGAAPVQGAAAMAAVSVKGEAQASGDPSTSPAWVSKALSLNANDDAVLNPQAETLAKKPVSAADSAVNLGTEPADNKPVASGKPGGKHLSGNAAIAAAAGQALPPGQGGAKEAVVLAVQDIADDLLTGGQLSATMQPLPGVRSDAGISSPGSAPIALAHPFEQVLRQAEPRINAAIEAPLRSPAFAAELSDKMVWLTTRQGQFAELTLNPPQMGAVEVRLTLSGADASAQFFSPNPAVREALEAALPRLRELMSQAGINLGEAGVHEQAFGRRDQPEQRGQVILQDGDMTMQHAAMADAARNRASGLGLVDLYI